MRRFAVLVVLALVVAACGGGTATTDPTTPPDAGTRSTDAGATSTTVPTTTDPTTSPDDGDTDTEDGTSTTAPAAGPPVSGVDGDPAPSVPIPVEGGDPVLVDQEVLPVFLVFWAEW